MRIKKIITKLKMPWYFIKFSQLILFGNVSKSVWRIFVWILGLKGVNVCVNYSFKIFSLFGLALIR